MPNIRTYEAPNLGLQPTEIGVRAAETAANRIGRDYNEAAAATTAVGNQFASGVATAVKAAGDVAVQFAEHREISHGAATFAQLSDDLTQKWNDIAKNADPNDPTVATKFRETALEPALEKYRDSFLTEGGQRFAESHIESLRNHMFQKTASDMSSLAAAAVKVNVDKTANSLSNTAMTDPSAVPELLKNADSLVSGMVSSSPGLKGADSARARLGLTQSMKEAIVKAGAIGAIQKSGDPEATAAEWGAKYPEYINGADLKTLSANARAQIRARRADATNARILDKQAREDASDKRETDYLKNLYSDKPEDQAKVSNNAIVNDPTLTRTAKERMIGVVNREFKPETAAQESNRNAMDLLSKIRLPQGDPERIDSLDPIYKARIDGKISRTDFESLRKEFTEVRTPEGERLTVRKNDFLKAVQPTIDKSNPLMGRIDQDGKLNSYRLMIDLDNKIAEYRKAGKNPYDLLDPSKPDYMGTPAALQPYMKPLQQSIQDQARRLTGGGLNITGPNTVVTGTQVTPAPKVEPRKPGESPAAYLKRIGGR